MNESDYDWMDTFTASSPPGSYSLSSLMRSGKAVRFKGCVFTEPIHLQTQNISRAWRFVNCTFKKIFDATDSKFATALSFKNCIFEESITLRNTEIGGTFDFTGSIVLLPADAKRPEPDYAVQLFDPPPESRSAKWDRLQVKGDLIADRSRFLGSLNLGEANIGGKASFRGMQIGAFPASEKNVDAKKLVAALRAHKPVRNWPLDTKRLFAGRFYMRGSAIAGDLDLSPFDLRTLAPSNPDEKDDPDEENDPDKKGDPDKEERLAVDYYAQTVLFGSLSIGLSHFHGRLNLRGARIVGALHAIMARVEGRVLADPFWTSDLGLIHRTKIGYAEYLRKEKLEPESTENVLFRRRTSLYFQDVVVSESIWLHGISTEGSLNFENAKIGGSLRLEPFEAPIATEAENAKSGDSRQEAPVEPETGSPEPMKPGESKASKKINYYQTTIRADERGDCIVLRNTTIKSSVYLHGAHLYGRIWGRNVHVEGDFMLGAHIGQSIPEPKPKKSPDSGQDKRQAQAEPSKPDQNSQSSPEPGKEKRPRHRWIQTVMHLSHQHEPYHSSISLHGATIGGCFDFSGADLKGSIRLRYARIQGAIIGGDPGSKASKYLPAGIGERTAFVGCDEEGYSLFLYNTRVGGNVHCPSIILEGALCIELSCIEGDAIFARSYINSRQLEKMLLMLDEKDRERKKEKRKKVIPRKARPPRSDSYAVKLDHSNVDADVQFEGARILGDFRAIGVKIGGDLEFAELRHLDNAKKSNEPVEGSTIAWNASNLFLQTLIKGEVNLTTATIARLRFGFPVPKLGPHHGKKFPAKSLIFGEVNLSHCKLNILQLWGNWPHADMQFWPAQHETSPLFILDDIEFQQLKLENEKIEMSSDKGALHSTKSHRARSAATQKNDKIYFSIHKSLQQKGALRSTKPYLTELAASLYKKRRIRLLRATRDLYRSGQGKVAHLAPAGRHYRLNPQQLTTALARFRKSLKILREDGPALHFVYRHARRGKLRINYRFRRLILTGRKRCGWLVSQWKRVPLRWKQRRLWLWATRLCRLFVNYRVVRTESDSWQRLRQLAKGRNSYTDFLKTAKNFDPAVYARVQRMLQASEHGDQARGVYLERRYRELYDGPRESIVFWLFRLFYFHSSGSGTSVKRLFVGYVIAVCFSGFLVFSHPESVEHPPTYMARVSSLASAHKDPDLSNRTSWDLYNGRPDEVALKEAGHASDSAGSPSHDAHPSPETPSLASETAKASVSSHAAHDASHGWSWIDGLWMGARIHTPFIHIIARSKWEPSSRPLQFGPGQYNFHFSVEYETYACVMQILSYLLLPIVVGIIHRFYTQFEIPEEASEE